MTSDDEVLRTGCVKWYDPAKGYGFILDDAGGPDILLHANALRDFGHSSIAEQAVVTFRAQKTERGAQVSMIVAIKPPPAPVSRREGIPSEALDTLPWQPARVKWLDREKGFGFASVFGHHEDLFLHIDTLRSVGLLEINAGEAVSVRVVKGPRGLLVAQVSGWETAEPRPREVLSPGAIADLGDDEFRRDHSQDQQAEASKTR